MHLWGFLVFGVVAAATWWAPPWPVEQALHTAGTVVILAGLFWAHRRVGLAPRIWLWALVFLTLHTIAARWLYSSVPYDDWTALLGFRLSDVFGWERNHFDRLVHFSYGLCLVMALRLKPLRALEFVLATSAVYELFEWVLAVVMDPAAAEAYNGQQGDLWDPHKDMALAALGAVVAVAIHTARRTPRQDAILGQFSGPARPQGGTLAR